MTDLIQISKTTINGAEINSVNLRDLHTLLELKSNFSHWLKDQVEILQTYEEGIDYIRTTKDRSNSTVVVKNHLSLKGKQSEYVISLDMAKHLAMLSKTSKGKEIRKYFIEVEKQNNKLPTPLETAKMLVQVLEDKEKLLLNNKVLEKQNNILMHTNKLYTATEISKELGFKSAAQLNKILSDLKVQYKVNTSWVFYAKYADCGYTSIKQHILESGKEIYDRKFTQTGRDFILKLLEGK